MDLLSRFQQQFTTQGNYLIAFSGGLDSTVLLALFKRLSSVTPLNLRAIHIHHGLSPNADYWVSHCQQICRQFDIPLIVEYVTLKDQKNIEANAREARYQAIQKHLQENEQLVTAHHLQDQSETFLLALKRGSGLQGLSAMQTHSTLWKMSIFRPLLHFTRGELESYAKQHHLHWIEDESNQNNHYDRNFLRNQILPPLRQRWANFDYALQRTAQHCFEQQQLINELLTDELIKNMSECQGILTIQDFSHYSPLKQKAMLRLWFAQNKLVMPSQLQLNQLINDVILARIDANPQFKLGSWILRRYQNRLYLTPSFSDLSNCIIPLTAEQIIVLPDNLGELSIQRKKDFFIFNWNNKQSVLPATDLPVSIAFGYKGKVKIHLNRPPQEIKKIWQNFNIPPWQRARIPLVFYGKKLQCAIGFFQVYS